MKYLLLLSVVLLQACGTTVPVSAKFPDSPGAIATQTCPALQQLPQDPKLSEVSNTITINYTTYYECAVKVDAWNDWYKIQKNIFEKAAK
jgi:hypothetical protein